MNHYFALRHGESIPNIRKVILSDLDTLTKNGEEQVRHSVAEAKEQSVLGSDTVIYASPLARCRRTAEIAREVLGVKDETIFDDRLRERWFGDWEGTSNDNYQKVWDGDDSNDENRDAGVESPADVARRVAELIRDLDKRYDGRNILLVSHGDALQILQTYFENASPSTHRSLPHLRVAEIRRIN
jgi:probable phosphoglycerate mutase